MIAPVSASEPAIEVHDLRKTYGENEAVRGIDFRVERGEVFGLLGPNGAGKTTTVEILEGYRERTVGRGQRAGPRPRSAASARCASGWGSCSRAAGIYRQITVREAVGALGGLLPASARRRRGHRPRRAERQGGRAHAHALGRPAAAAGLRARAGRRPRADLPRRADHRLRPRGAAHRVGHRALAARPRQDRAAHHALPRRGAGARRPRGDHQGRPDPRRGRRRTSSGRARRATGSPGATATARRSSARPTTRRRCCTS